jgi:hypothetical protein
LPHAAYGEDEDVLEVWYWVAVAGFLVLTVAVVAVVVLAALEVGHRAKERGRRSRGRAV